MRRGSRASCKGRAKERTTRGFEAVVGEERRKRKMKKCRDRNVKEGEGEHCMTNASRRRSWEWDGSPNPSERGGTGADVAGQLTEEVVGVEEHWLVEEVMGKKCSWSGRAGGT